MNDKKFVYTYSAPTEKERREIEDIKRQYSGEKTEKDKLSRLRELHARVKNPPLTAALTLGVAGVLIFGTGLTMILEWNMLLWGAAVMTAGCVPAGLAYPVKRLLLARGRKKYGAEIVNLSEELLNEKNN